MLDQTLAERFSDKMKKIISEKVPELAIRTNGKLLSQKGSSMQDSLLEEQQSYCMIQKNKNDNNKRVESISLESDDDIQPQVSKVSSFMVNNFTEQLKRISKDKKATCEKFQSKARKNSSQSEYKNNSKEDYEPKPISLRIKNKKSALIKGVLDQKYPQKFFEIQMKLAKIPPNFQLFGQQNHKQSKKFKKQKKESLRSRRKSSSSYQQQVSIFYSDQSQSQKKEQSIEKVKINHKQQRKMNTDIIQKTAKNHQQLKQSQKKVTVSENQLKRLIQDCIFEKVDILAEKIAYIINIQGQKPVKNSQLSSLMRSQPSKKIKGITEQQFYLNGEKIKNTNIKTHTKQSSSNGKSHHEIIQEQKRTEKISSKEKISRLEIQQMIKEINNRIRKNQSSNKRKGRKAMVTSALQVLQENNLSQAEKEIVMNQWIDMKKSYE